MVSQFRNNFQIFLTESNINVLDAIDEEDFDGFESETPTRYTYEDLEDYKSHDTRASNISSISEEVPDEDYDTDLEVDEPESKCPESP